MVTGESEEESNFFLNALKSWLKKPVCFATIDFSSRLESSVKAMFPDADLQKCVFHAAQLLTRGLLKELTRLKNEHFHAHVKEWNLVRSTSFAIEKKSSLKKALALHYPDVRLSWQVYQKLRRIFQQRNPLKIKRDLEVFFSTSKFLRWRGSRSFLNHYTNAIAKRKFAFTSKGLKYIASHAYKAWRATIRQFRKRLERLRSRFNKAKYLVLTNPLNTKKYQRKKLRKYLKVFPWLKPIRSILVQFYCQFETPPEKRSSLTFLSQLVSEKSHSWLKSAVDTLIENEDHIFKFQSVQKTHPKLKRVKSIKVVNESVNRIVNQLFRTQCGMRTLDNVQMRISQRLKCPIIVSPSLLEKIK